MKLITEKSQRRAECGAEQPTLLKFERSGLVCYGCLQDAVEALYECSPQSTEPTTPLTEVRPLPRCSGDTIKMRRYMNPPLAQTDSLEPK